MYDMIRVARFRYKSASCEVSLFTDRVGWVARVWSNDRRRGHARGLLEAVCSFADENGITLQLDVGEFGPYDPMALSNPQLVEFYEKFGFVRTGGRTYKPSMSRAPREKYMALNETQPPPL